MQIVAADNNKRSWLYTAINPRRLRRAKCFSVCLIKYFHATQIHFTNTQCERKQLICLCICHPLHAFMKKGVHGLIAIPQHGRMIRICRQAAQAKKNKRAQGAFIFWQIPKNAQIVIIRLFSITTDCNSCAQFMRFVREPQKFLIVKIDVCQRGK